MCSSELKKLASTPSLPGVAVLLASSDCAEKRESDGRDTNVRSMHEKSDSGTTGSNVAPGKTALEIAS